MSNDNVKTVRLGDEQARVVEVVRQRLEKDNPGLRVTTSDAIRIIISSSGQMLADDALTAASADAEAKAA